MDNVAFPHFLILPDSHVRIYYEDSPKVNSKTKTSVVIEGPSNGFLSLSNMINVYTSYLYDKIVLTEFSFVKSELIFEISADNENFFETGSV